MDFDFEGTFDEDYLFFYSGFHTPEVNRETAEKIVALLQLSPGQSLLDVPCGYGRISNELAAMGYCVTGLDATKLFLERARSDAEAKGAKVRYMHGDMRALPFEDNEFDVLINWFTSFGYFDDETNHKVLGEFRRVLKPGGTLVIDHQNRDRMLANWRQCSITEWEGNYMIDRAEFDPVTGRAPNDRLIIRDDKIRKTHYSVRMFAASEMALWLERAGFEQVKITDIEGEPFTMTSKRMVCRAIKG